MLHLFSNLSFPTSIFLILALTFVLFYEIINGFHDTANAVATVIYTRSLRSNIAVIIAGILNFIGVILGGLSVAYAIVHLIPTNILLNIDSIHGLLMIFSILFSAIIWNLGTWYLGLPASSSHTLIGSIIGISLVNALCTESSIFETLNMHNMKNILISLIISPIIGLIISGMLIFFLRYIFKKRSHIIHRTPYKQKKFYGKNNPPFWIRIALIFSSIGISYSHGANDGQKGIGLIMLILIGMVPSKFILNINSSVYEIQKTKIALNKLEKYNNINKYVLVFQKNNFLDIKKISNPLNNFTCNTENITTITQKSKKLLHNVNTYNTLNINKRMQIRRLLMCLANITEKLSKISNINKENKIFLNTLKKDLLITVEYAPTWIIIIIATALSLGTMIGWKRVAITISEKIGKKDMTYAQGISAQMTSAFAIGIASYIGMPVSTPHILSSSIAGAALADKSGLQYKTIKIILLAWIFTIPISMLMSSTIYWCTIKIFLN